MDTVRNRSNPDDELTYSSVYSQHDLIVDAITALSALTVLIILVVAVVGGE